MAKRNQKGELHPCYGPCVDCGATDSRGPGKHDEPKNPVLKIQFNTVKRVTSSGRASIVRLCDKCVTKV